MKSRPKHIAFVVAASLLTATALPSTPAAAQPAAVVAQKNLAAGAKAARAKKWDEALAAYKKAHAAKPSAASQQGIAESLDGMGKTIEAIDAYETLFRDYGKKMLGFRKKAAETKLEALQAEL